MITQTEIHVSALLQPYAPDPDEVYSIDIAARLTGLPRHLVLVCCKRGLVQPWTDPEYGGYFFDVEAIRTLRQIEYLHARCGVNLEGIEIILQLIDEVERLNDRVLR
jgi:DNA-binding transcriptional MerR regulator